MLLEVDFDYDLQQPFSKTTSKYPPSIRVEKVFFQTSLSSQVLQYRVSGSSHDKRPPSSITMATREGSFYSTPYGVRICKNVG